MPYFWQPICTVDVMFSTTTTIVMNKVISHINYIQINAWAFPYWLIDHPVTQSRANMGRGIMTRSIWKCPCIKLFIAYFRHLEKRHTYWPETKSRLIWKWSCSNPITGYYPGVWKYGQFTSGHIGHTKMPLFELSM